MRSRLKRRTQESSFDLFLDTICNAFGGIMFIAILVSILLQVRGETSAITKEKILSETESQSLQTRLEKLQSQVEQQIQLNSDREKLLVSEQTVEIRDLQTQRDAALARLVQAQQRQQSLLQANTANDERNQKLQQDLKELSQELSSARIAVSQRSKEIAKSLDAVETTATLPKVTTTLKGNLLFAIRYGKLYLISDISGNSKLGVNENHVVASQGTRDMKVQLQSNAGWDLSTAEAETAMQSIMGTHPNNDIFFSIAVWPDSFDVFPKWKEITIGNGYDYDLSPVDDVEELIIGKTISATVQ